MTTPESVPRLIIEEQPEVLDRFLAGLQEALLKNPGAIQSILTLLIQEGHRFGQSEEGQKWRLILSEAELVKQGRFVWDAYTIDALLDSEGGVLPTAWLDLLTAALATPNLESILSTRVFDAFS